MNINETEYAKLLTGTIVKAEWCAGDNLQTLHLDDRTMIQVEDGRMRLYNSGGAMLLPEVEDGILDGVTDAYDMMRDEFVRIANCPGATPEIIQLSRRALEQINRRFPVLAERDRLEARVMGLTACLGAVLETISKHRWKVNGDEGDTISEAKKYLEKGGAS